MIETSIPSLSGGRNIHNRSCAHAAMTANTRRKFQRPPVASSGFQEGQPHAARRYRAVEASDKLDKPFPLAQYFTYESIGDSGPLEANAHMKVEIWSDVVCPWCYIGKRRFESALAEFP